MSEWNANCWSSAARSLLYFAWLQRCDERIERLEELCQTLSVHVSPLDIDNTRWRGLHDSRVQRHNWSVCTRWRVREWRVRDKRSLVWRETHSRIVFRPVWWSTRTTSSRGGLNVGNVVKRVRNSKFYAVERHHNEHRVSSRWTINANKIIIRIVRYTHRYMQMVISMSSSPRWRRSKNFRNATADGYPHLTVNVNKN